MRTTITNPLDTVSTVIANGASLSAAVDLGGLRLFAIQMPASWTAANLTFQCSHDNGATWNNLYDVLGNEYTVTASTARTIIVDPSDFAAVQLIKVRSGTAGTPVNQGAERTLTLVLRGI